MTDWQKDKQWSDRFIDQLKLIAADLVIAPADVRLDMKENTDLIVLDAKAKTIACRIRRYEYLARYGHEFTIRADRPSGVLTEYAKIIKGFGDYMIYGFADAEAVELIQWHIVDLAEFRLWAHIYQTQNNGQAPGLLRHNHDGSSCFRVFSTYQLPDGCVTTHDCMPFFGGE